MRDEKTIDAYDSQIEAYVTLTQRADVDPAVTLFMSKLPAGGYILDLGCGPGAASAEFKKNSFRVDPVDASIEMVNLANASFAINARQATFGDIDGENIYDAVWANFSLLHAPAVMFPIYLGILYKALSTNGLLYLGMKLGAGEQRDSLGRHYTYYSESDLKCHLSKSGFSIVHIETGEAMGLAGDVEPWITILARKQ